MTREQRLAMDGVQGDPILFYRPQDKWGVFSNFSLHSVTLPHPFTDHDIVYRTSEHRYQAMKAVDQVDHDYVRSAATPSESKKFGGPGPHGIMLREDWGRSYGDLCYYVMLEAVLAKAQQHDDFMHALETARVRGSHIYEDSPIDDIWGWRYRDDHRGKNLLGRAIMQARDILLP